jgi:hypothetical protein
MVTKTSGLQENILKLIYRIFVLKNLSELFPIFGANIYLIKYISFKR